MISLFVVAVGVSGAASETSSAPFVSLLKSARDLSALFLAMLKHRRSNILPAV